MIAPAHGAIWRDNPMQIVDLYDKWSREYQEDQVTVVYDTMWEGTTRSLTRLRQRSHVRARAPS